MLNEAWFMNWDGEVEKNERIDAGMSDQWIT